MNIIGPAVGAAATYAVMKLQEPSKPSEQFVAKLGDNWLAAVCSHNPARVTNLYCTDGILIGTVAQQIKRGRPAIRSYFDEFLTNEGICGTFTSRMIQTYPGWAIESGTYTFQWMQDGEQITVPARYSFVYRLTPGGWKIQNHHSSTIPA